MVSPTFQELYDNLKAPTHFVWEDVPYVFGIFTMGMVLITIISCIILLITALRKQENKNNITRALSATITFGVITLMSGITALSIANYSAQEFQEDLDAKIATQLIQEYDAYGHTILIDESIETWFEKATDNIMEPAYIDVEVEHDEVYTYEIVLQDDEIELFSKPGEDAPLPKDLISLGNK